MDKETLKTKWKGSVYWIRITFVNFWITQWITYTFHHNQESSKDGKHINMYELTATSVI